MDGATPMKTEQAWMEVCENGCFKVWILGWYSLYLRGLSVSQSSVIDFSCFKLHPSLLCNSLKFLLYYHPNAHRRSLESCLILTREQCSQKGDCPQKQVRVLYQRSSPAVMPVLTQQEMWFALHMHSVARRSYGLLDKWLCLCHSH
jgi:hypothetical protein